MTDTTDTITSVTDNQGNIWTAAATAASLSALTSRIYYCASAQAGATTVTVTSSNSIKWELIVREYSGLASTSIIDVIGHTTEGSNTTSHSTSVTTTNANDRLIAFYACNAQTDTFSAASPLANFVKESGAPGLAAMMGDLALTTTGSKTPVFSSVGSDKGIVWALAIKNLVGTALLPAPSTVTAVAGNGSVFISWSAVASATGYNVYRSTTFGTTGSLYAGNIGTANLGDGAATNGTTYYYSVTAINSAGVESAVPRQSAGATPSSTNVPSAPTSVVATAQNAAVAVTWAAVAGVTSYRVYRSTVSGTLGALVGSPTTPSFTDTGLTNGTPYYYQVSAVSANGEGAKAAQVSATPASGVTVRTPTWYTYGSPPNGRTMAQLVSVFQSKFAAWKAYVLTQDGMPAGMPAGAWRVKVPDVGSSGAGNVNCTLAQGIGYGMILTAYASDPTSPMYDSSAAAIFQGLWTYYNYYKDVNGLMNWRVDANGTVNGFGAVSDADADAAWGLYVFASLHEQGKTGFYGTALTTLLNSIAQNNFFPATDPTWPNLLKNGDQWDSNVDNYTPGYISPAPWKYFGQWTGDTIGWNNRINANRTAGIDYFRNTYPTGYVPDASTRAGAAADGYFFGMGYNALRMPWRQAIFGFNENDASALAILHKLADAERTRASNTPASALAEGNMAGTAFGSYINKAYISAFGVAGSANSADTTWANACVTWLVSGAGANEDSYFGRSLETLAMLVLCGEARTSGFTYSALPGGTGTAQSGIALVQTKTAHTTSTTTAPTITPDTAIGVGHLLVLFVNATASTDSIVGVSDNLGNTWVKAGAGVINGNCLGEFWYCKSSASGTPTITVTSSTAWNWNLIFREYSGTDRNDPLDRQATTVESSFVTTHTSTLTSATQQANEVVIAAYANTHPGDTFTAAGSYGDLVKEDGAPTIAAVLADKFVTSVQQHQAQFTSAQFDQGVLYCITFRSATASAIPAAPTSVVPVAGDANVALSWATVSTAATYKIYRSLASGTGSGSGGVVGTLIGTVSSTTFTDSNLDNGTTYYYVVVASNAAGDSVGSSQVAATPEPPLPSAPTNLVGTPGNGSVTIAWTAGANADSYDIDRDGNYLTTVPKEILTYTDNGRTNGAEYEYYVVAINDAGFTRSGSVFVTPSASATFASPPPAPTSLVITPGNQQDALSWNDAVGALSHNIYRSTSPGVRGQLVFQGAPPSTRTDLPGWKLIFDDDFNATTAAEGQFLAKYGTFWEAYPTDYLTTYGQNGGTGDHYEPNDISVISGASGAVGNVMNMRLRPPNLTPDGKAWGTAPQVKLPGATAQAAKTAYQLYGRYEVRFRVSTPAAGWHPAWLLWPQSEVWPGDGEIDYPEGGLMGTIAAFNHRQGGTSGNDQDVFETTTPFGTGWHVAVTEWGPNTLKFILDGVTIGTVTTRIPNTPMRYVLQTENADDPSDQPTAEAVIQVDYVAVWAYSPTTTGAGSVVTTQTGSTSTTGAVAWIDPNSVAQTAATNETDPTAKKKLQALANVPQTYWSGYEWDFQCNGVAAAMLDAKNKGTCPSFVTYSIPDRDLSGSSAGGAPDDDSYMAWIQRFANALVTQTSVKNVIVIMEPDALPQMYDQRIAFPSEWNSRLNVLHDACQVIKSTCYNAGMNVLIYADVGHSAWHPDYHDALAMVNALPSLNWIDGVSLNVSNYRTDTEVEAYGLAITQALGTRFTYVYDTGRNARPGPPWDASQYQNMPALLGAAPSIDPPIQRCKAQLWIKRPGESDGNSAAGGDTYGIAAGTFIRQYALNLIDQSVAAGTFTVGA